MVGKHLGRAAGQHTPEGRFESGTDLQSGTETLDSRTDGTNTGQYRSGYNGAVLKTVQR